MNHSESFSNSLYTDHMRLAEREFSAFIAAITELFGVEHARLSAEDWLDESELMNSQPQSTSRDWRNVTIAASARFASRCCNPSSQARCNRIAAKDLLEEELNYESRTSTSGGGNNA